MAPLGRRALHSDEPGGTGWQAVLMQEFAAAAGGIELWMGEGGPHSNGGGGPYSATLLSSFASCSRFSPLK